MPSAPSATPQVHHEITVPALAEGLRAGTMLLIDVREADEFAAGRIPGAINLPLSRFDPAQLPDAGGREVILGCQRGRRSAMALDACHAAGVAADTHLAGGFLAWTAAGLPVEV